MKDKILEFVKCRLSVAGVSFAASAHKDLFKDHELETFLSFAYHLPSQLLMHIRHLQILH